MRSLGAAPLNFSIGDENRRARTILNLGSASAKLFLVAMMLWGVLWFLPTVYAIGYLEDSPHRGRCWQPLGIRHSHGFCH
ncbi:hypothetical protein GCM10023156_09440 [Novipirellula rosea]|uniref:Uncharacterized protein n=1 Tax=Novipirellula rosea TaxID=1031540 RepID=A0ABP8MD36_9BACT